MQSTPKDRILYVCPFNGCRSGIAKHVSLQLAATQVDAYSACFNPGPMCKMSVIAMREMGYELPYEETRSVFERFSDNELFDYVITLCDNRGKEQAALFQRSIDQLYGNTAIRLSWSIGDFQALRGSEDLQLEMAVKICDDIIKQVQSLSDKLKTTAARPADDASYSIIHSGDHRHPRRLNHGTQVSTNHPR